MAGNRNRWDDEYDSFREDHDDNRITVDPFDTAFEYQDARYNS